MPDKKIAKISTLRPYPANPREGDVGAIVESLETLGQYRPIVVNKRTMTVLAGNHTLKAAESLGWTEIAVTWVDVDEETAERIVLVDNRTNDLATYDSSTLVELLADLAATDDGLAGTGYDGDALDELLADLNTPLTNEEQRPDPTLNADVLITIYLDRSSYDAVWERVADLDSLDGVEVRVSA